jgi:hypothetical protein
MATIDTLRFADTRVGQPLPAARAARLGSGCSWPRLAERYVQEWAGSGATIARREVTEIRADDVDELVGSIYARHLDDSFNVDVQVVGRTASGTRLIDLVRVQLR